ncbi:HAD family hydrolase [Roseitranquillus sediminis]|uniref:HAD family hydrolase n=1 Tax=Roseitranquillus sediminis TaxID=2809051 RepID=UPI001D0C3EB4|nr:HAD family phosphatase [Roseitranquillus sediminis]MBM9593216.1 HAD family phosphatase [Roseitranquillus sediminis]
MIDVVVFDIGNVLVEWQPERYYDGRIGAERRSRMFAEVDLHGMNDRVDRGEAFRAEVHALAEAHPEWREEILEWHDNWAELAAPLIPHSVALLRALRSKGVPVWALSNFGVETFAMAETLYPVLGEFDRRFISGHLKMAKPDMGIFEEVEREGGVPPERLFLTDDREDNIAVARTRGWQTHRFDGPEGLAERLVAEGLLTEDEARAP